MNLKIIYEDNYIIVIEKPVGMPVQSDRTMDMDLVNALKNYLACQDISNHNPYIGLIHRLDRAVGGIMVFGKNKYATKVLNEQLRENKIVKKYIAVTIGKFHEQQGTLVDYIIIDKRNNLSHIVCENAENAQKAVLEYQVLKEEFIADTDMSLVEIKLITGRHHQIRVQMASLGHGLWGDAKYNQNFITGNKWSNVALYSYFLEFRHPKTKEKVTFCNSPNHVYPFSEFIKEEYN